ncbi:putative oxidoreductase [Cladobotryum mycophilum]|uniref:Oxidoreductase n=1 Tax=Cladobotryum mycophilum TaxID=491253 RepID=A0ABR0SVG4_9HYPO
MVTNILFNRESTCDEVASHFILITGVSPNSLGEAMSYALVKHHPESLIFLTRTINKAEEVIAAIQAKSPAIETRFHVIQVDLSLPQSIRHAAAEIQSITSKIDIMINNAGVMALPERTLAETGIEMQLATNFLGHFYLTKLLMPQLIAGEGRSRVVNVVSGAFMIQPFRFDDYNFDGDKGIPPEQRPDIETAEKLGLFGLEELGDKYVPFLAYAQSNTASMLFTRGLNEGLARREILAFSTAPGVVVTELQRHLPPDFRNPKGFYKTAGQGAASFLVAALDPNLESQPGAFINEAQLEETVPHVESLELARKIWQLAETWTEM